MSSIDHHPTITERRVAARPWDEEAAPPARLSVRLVWAAIAGYLAVVLALALASAARPAVLSWLGRDSDGEPTWIFDAGTTHLLGAAGALVVMLVVTRNWFGDGHPRRRRSDAPHDGWSV